MWHISDDDEKNFSTKNRLRTNLVDSKWTNLINKKIRCSFSLLLVRSTHAEHNNVVWLIQRQSKLNFRNEIIASHSSRAMKWDVTLLLNLFAMSKLIKRFVCSERDKNQICFVYLFVCAWVYSIGMQIDELLMIFGERNYEKWSSIHYESDALQEKEQKLKECCTFMRRENKFQTIQSLRGARKALQSNRNPSLDFCSVSRILRSVQAEFSEGKFIMQFDLCISIADIQIVCQTNIQLNVENKMNI